MVKKELKKEMEVRKIYIYDGRRGGRDKELYKKIMKKKKQEIAKYERKEVNEGGIRDKKEGRERRGEEEKEEM